MVVPIELELEDLVSRIRGLGQEVDVDSEIDAVWNVHQGSVASAIGVRVPFEGGTAVVFFAILEDVE